MRILTLLANSKKVAIAFLIITVCLVLHSKTALSHITTRDIITLGEGVDKPDVYGSTICTWIGTTNDDWNVGSNWCSGAPPTLTTDVYIPAATPHDPKIYTAAALAKSIQLNSGASLTMSGIYDITIASGGTFTNDGTFDATGSTTGAVIFAGNGTISGTTTFKNVTINGSVDFGTASTITGTLLLNSGGVAIGSSTHLPIYTSTSTLIYNETVTTKNEWYQGGSGTTAAGIGVPQDVTIQSGTVTIPNSGGANRAIAGNLTISSATTLQFTSGTSRDLFIAGNWTNNGGTFAGNGRRVTFNAASGTQTVSGSTTFFDLTLNNSGATTDFGTSTITVADEFRVTAGTMNGNASTFIFTGSASTLEGAGSKYFYNLQINSGANLSDLTASAGNTHISNSFANNGVSFNQKSTHTAYFDKSGGTETFSGSGATTFGNLVIGDGSGLSTATTLNAGADFTVSGGSLTFYHSSIYNGSNNTATFSTNAATVSGSGTANFYNAITNVALNLGSGISNISNNLQINTGGSIVTNAPLYGSAATLIYNTTTLSLPTSIEWTNNTSSTGSGAPYSVSIQNTNSVVIGGDRTIPGTLNLTAGSLDINSKTLTVSNGFTGTGGNLKGVVTSNLIAGGAGTINFNAAANYLRDFTINNGANLSLGSALNIAASDGTNANTFGTLISNGGSLNTAGFLSLKSDANGTARVGYSTGSITGNVTVERYIPPRRAWRFLSVPFSSSSQTILSAWQESATPYPTPNVSSYGSAPNVYNPNPGYGTEITYDNCTCNGYDVNITYNPSLKIWDNVNNTWSSYAPHTNATLITDYNGAYCIFVRGSRAIDLSQGTSATADATVLRATGVLNQIGNINTSINYSGSAGGFVFVGNPYASSVDLANVLSTGRSTGIDNNKFWLWDPKLNGFNKVGAYVTYDNGIMTPIGVGGSYSSVTTVIQSGQAFIVQLSSGSTLATIKYKEDDKTPSENNVFGKKAQVIHPVIYSNLVNPANNGLVDGVAAGFGDKFSEKVDENDAQKIFNFDENLELIRDNNKLAIEFRPPPKARDTLFYRLYLAQHPYALQIFTQKIANLNLKAWLVDKYLNTQTEINLLDTTVYNFTPNPDTNSYRNRFMLVFKHINKVKNNNNNANKLIASRAKSSVGVYPNPVAGGNFNLLLNNLSAGVYTLNLYTMSGDLVVTKKVQHTAGSGTYNIKLPAYIAAGKYNIQFLDSTGNIVSSMPVILD